MSNPNKISEWFKDRLGLGPIVSKFMKEPLPASVSWPYCLGSQCLFLLVVQFVTGAFLGLNYSASPEQAYNSVKYITEEATLGYIVRGLHHWSASFLIVLLVMHMMRIIFFGSYKKPRELTWIVGVVMFFVVLAFGFTGYLLPWNQKSYWATVVGTNIAGSVPLIGEYLTRILRGGSDIGAVTLTRFYAIHVFFLPALIVPLIVGHIYLMRRHGISSHYRVKPGTKEGTIPFFPHHAFKDAIVFSIVFTILAVVVMYVPAELGEIADPTDTSFVPRPEWYFLFLFEMLKYFKGPFEVVGTVIIPTIGAGVLIALPFIDPKGERNPFRRPIVSSLTMASLILVISLTLLGARKPVHEEDIAHAKMEKGCGRCHVLQLNMYSGIRKEGDTPNPNPKFTAGLSCNIACHSGLKKGHSISSIRKRCVLCHGKEYGPMFDNWRHTYIETVEGIKAFIELVTTFEEKIIIGPDKEEVRKMIKAEINSANEIIDFVEHAKGVHNPDFSAALINDVKERLQVALKLLFDQLKKERQPEM